MPESRVEHDTQPRDTKLPARIRSKTAVQEERGEPSERRKKPKKTRRQVASNLGAREDAQSKELHELSVFKRVHIHTLPVQINRAGERGWIAGVLGQSQQKTRLKREGYPSEGYVIPPVFHDWPKLTKASALRATAKAVSNHSRIT